jgi:hypothetical protein
MRSDKKSSYTNSKLQPLVQLETREGGGKPGRYLAYGAATDGDEGEYNVGIMDNGGWTCERRNIISSEHHNNFGGKQANGARQGYQAAGSYRLREEGMDTV